MNGLPQNLASIPNRPAARCKLLLCPSSLPNWRNAEGLKSYAGKALFKGKFKKLTHRPICRQVQTVFCHGLSETLRINIYFDVTCDRYQFDSQHFNGHMSQVTFPLTSKSHRQREQGNTTRGGIIRPLSQPFSLWYDTHHRSFNRPPEKKQADWANSISCLSESNGDTRCKRLELRSVGRVEHIDGIVFEIASQVFQYNARRKSTVVVLWWIFLLKSFWRSPSSL